MGNQVDDRQDERLATKFAGAYSTPSQWDRLAARAEDYAQTEGIPFDRALNILTNRKPSR